MGKGWESIRLKNSMLPFLVEGRITKSQWENLSDERLEELAKEIFLYYREKGFPYYQMSIDEKMSHLNKLKNFLQKNGDSMITDSNIKMTMHGLSLAWSYFPHAWEVRCNKMKTPFEVFADDTLFMGAIKKRLKRGTYFSNSGIRKSLRSFSGTQGVSNFKPTSAGAIYRRYCKAGSSVWDMSCGYGGRLLGAVASGVIEKYIGTEPCLKTYNGLLQIKNELCNDMQTEIHMIGSEDFIPPNNSFDMCFTSPPYFNTEKYSNEKTQSYIKYSTKDEWNEKFLLKTIKNCMTGLKKNGILAINVANVKSHLNLEETTKELCEMAGFRHIETLKLLLSSISKGGYKSEPVFVFKK